MAAWFNGLFKEQSKKRVSRRQHPRLGGSLLAGERLEHRALLSADAAPMQGVMIADPVSHGVPIAFVSSPQAPATANTAASMAVESSPQPSASLIASRPGEQVLPAVHPPYSSGWRPFDPYTTPLGAEPLSGSVMSNPLPPLSGNSMNTSESMATTPTSGTDTGQPVAGEPTSGYPGPAGIGVYPFPVR